MADNLKRVAAAALFGAPRACCNSAAKLERIREAAKSVDWEWLQFDARDVNVCRRLEALRKEIES